ncbi:fimbrial protein [Serratia marcescens]|uniref:fimbrial protein n=1 Tax=Serratia marcescens TaxID=615 RepID=UPI0034E1E752
MKSLLLRLTLALSASMSSYCSVATTDNRLLHGALVTYPCTLRMGDEDIQLELDPVIDKYLYMHSRTPAKPFSLTLQDCDVSVGKTVKLTFSGTESAALPGLLALDGGSQASGIALGIATAEGKPVVLNKPGQGYALVNGTNSLQLQVYIQAEGEAIAQKKISLGAFSAVTTFGLEYE